MVRVSDQDASWTPKSHWRDFIFLSHLDWERLGITQEERENIAGTIHTATTTRPLMSGKKWMDGWIFG